MKKLLVILLAMSTLSVGMAGGSVKQDVCHYDADADAYHLINISENAFQKHLDHGDEAPGTEPGELAADCSAIPPATADAYGNVNWTSSGGLGNIGTSLWLFAGTTEHPAGSGFVDMVIPTNSGDKIRHIRVDCVRIDGNTVNWGGVIMTSTDPGEVTNPIVGWAKVGAPHEIGAWKNGFANPCTVAALQWIGGGTVDNGVLVINS